MRQNFASFQEHFDKQHGHSVCSFNNIGGDATLVTPLPIRTTNGFLDFKCLSSFVENADHKTQTQLWKVVAIRLSDQLTDGRPRWLSTNGMGVHYLHIRIDSRPKYYSYKVYHNLGYIHQNL